MNTPSHSKELAVEKCLREVRQTLGTMQYGTITIVVQDGLPIQIDKTEKTRLK